MSKPVQQVKVPEKSKASAIQTLLGLPSILFSVLFISLLTSIVIELVGMTFIWSDQGVNHSKEMLELEMSYLADNGQETLYGLSPLHVGDKVSQQVNELYEGIGLIQLLEKLESPLNGQSSLMDNFKVLYWSIRDYVIASLTITKLFFIKLVVVLFSLPVFLLSGVGALVDGLVQRDLRKFGGGNESAFIYHKIKPVIFPCVSLAIAVYLGLPVSLHPNFVFVPAASFSALAIYLTATTFKKHL
ncbi:TIGR03747 family integrating conjugative element membrane protein [Hahella ganghwensis]|uniref:TIGR03747 family integrating conjugative element membrane protein n=1 Tax=Hahella ganghwensis TaxID=286420 RepID=UPI00036E346B|nr:TIGR03747 family integrating conjugative element membrane protein [Hahella ganghwensis]